MSSFHIVPLTDAVLKIENPPSYWVGGFCLLVCAICLLSLSGSLLAGAFRSERAVSFAGERTTVSGASFGWKGHLVIASIAFLAGSLAWFTLQPASLVLDRQAQTYTLSTGHLPFTGGEESFPLHQIAYATLETDTAAQRFVIVLQDGQRYGLGAYTDRGGQSEAVAAVNRFLGVSQPGEPTHE